MKSSVKVFSATRHSERNDLGERITLWLNQSPSKRVIEVRTLQSSDSEFHCLSIIYFYEEAPA